MSTDQPKPSKLSYSIAEFCTAAGLGRSLVYLLIQEGKLPTRKCGRRTLILYSDAQAFLENLPAGG